MADFDDVVSTWQRVKNFFDVVFGGISWDSEKMELTLGKKWSAIFAIETAIILFAAARTVMNIF